MKEAVGESAMTIITIVLVSVSVLAIAGIVGTLLNNQQKRSNCENAGYTYEGGKCMNDGAVCTYNKTIDEYDCGD